MGGVDGVDCKCMESLAAGWCTVKQLMHNQTTINLICGDLEISVAMIRLRVNGLKKPGLVYLLDLFGEREEQGWCD